MRDSELSKAYIGEKISWFQFGLLSTHHILADAENHLTNLQGLVSLENTKGETSWHVLALAQKININTGYQKTVNFLQSYCTSSLLKQNIKGQTALDIVKNNIDFNKSPRGELEIRYPEQSLADNKGIYSLLEKIVL